ncbi:MAG TPA: molybdopterin converting factor subunit 1 [Burkholderiaceae bacterium]|nr:molybdopterin converting factor subunit 1 [Burkholderiaceae bacterium]
MKLSVLYFARLRDAIGRSREDIEVPAGVTTVGELRAWLSERGAPWSGAFAAVRPIRAALDQAMAGDTTRLRDGAEVAFFPPVTGG